MSPTVACIGIVLIGIGNSSATRIAPILAAQIRAAGTFLSFPNHLISQADLLSSWSCFTGSTLVIGSSQDASSKQQLLPIDVMYASCGKDSEFLKKWLATGNLSGDEVKAIKLEISWREKAVAASKRPVVANAAHKEWGEVKYWFPQKGTVQATVGVSWIPGPADDTALVRIVGASLSIPRNKPLILQGSFGIDTLGQPVPIASGESSVDGFVISDLTVFREGVEETKYSGYEARLSDFMPIYRDSTRREQLGWGYAITSGQLVVPSRLFSDTPPGDVYVDNSFSVERLSETAVRISLDPKIGHRLCVVSTGPTTANVLTAGYFGSKCVFR